MSIQTSPNTSALMAALLQFQGAVEGVKRDSTNPHFKNRYASLENVVDTARPHLQENGLVFMQAPGSVIDGCIEVTTRISHAESGEWIQSTMHIPLAKRDPQGAGSALTYGQRYSLMAALGLPPTDDDAETSYDRKNDRPKPESVQVDNTRADEIATVLIEAMAFSRNMESLQAWKRDEWKHIKDLPKQQYDRVVAAFKDQEAKLAERVAA